MLLKKIQKKNVLNGNVVKKKVFTSFKPYILSRHPSHDPLRKGLPLLPFRSLVRLGSTTVLNDDKSRVEINSVQGVKNSSNKLLMKKCFTRVGVKTAQWWTVDTNHINFYLNGNPAVAGTTPNTSGNLPYPIVVKSLHGSRGEGNFKFDNQRALEQWMQGKNLSNYILERFSTFSKEYRIHVTNSGCFYACRKLVKNTAPEGMWQKHDDGNIAWILQSNESFKQPSNWNSIVEDCIRAKNSLGLDICSFDVMVQGSSKTNPDWIIIESQSAPSFGDVTLQKYIEVLPQLIKDKRNNG